MKIGPLTLLAIGMMLLVGTGQALGAETAAKSEGKYIFTSDWFSENIPTWNRVLHELKGKPNLTYLEIGAYEGRSFLWVMDHILTHPSSNAIAIDTFDKIFDSDPEKTFLENIRRSGSAAKVRVIKGRSQEKLRGLKLNSMDLIYIDGDHRSKGVLIDAVLCWGLLKEGGLLIFDDYRLSYELPLEMRPEFAIDVFQSIFRDEFEILVKDYQFIVRKSKMACNEAVGSVKRLEMPVVCSHLGPYVYYWKPQKLYETATNREIPLNRQEVSIIENTLSRLTLAFRVGVESREMEEYRNLLNKLGLRDIGATAKELPKGP